MLGHSSCLIKLSRLNEFTDVSTQEILVLLLEVGMVEGRAGQPSLLGHLSFSSPVLRGLVLPWGQESGQR